MASLLRSPASRAAVALLTRRVVSSSSVASAAPARAVLQQQARGMSVFQNLRDTVSHKLEERNQAKAQDAYRDQVNDLAYSTKFDLDDFYKQLKKNADASGVNGWKSMIPGVSDMTAVQQLKAFMTILEAVEPEYRANPRLLTGKAKRLAVEKSGHSAEELNTLLRNFDQMSALRTWLVKRVERGLPLPESMEETTELVRLDPTGFPAKKFRAKQRRY